MRKVSTLLITVSLVAVLAACGGGGKKSSTTSTTTPLPKGCPAQTLMNIAGSGGQVSVAAATSRAVVRNGKGTITVYLVSKLLNYPNERFIGLSGANAKLDGEGTIIASGTTIKKTPPTAGAYVVDPKAPLQLIEYSVQRNGEVLTKNITKPSKTTTLTITSLTPTLTCGQITGPEGSASFIANTISAN